MIQIQHVKSAVFHTVQCVKIMEQNVEIVIQAIMSIPIKTVLLVQKTVILVQMKGKYVWLATLIIILQ